MGKQIKKECGYEKEKEKYTIDKPSPYDRSTHHMGK